MQVTIRGVWNKDFPYPGIASIKAFEENLTRVVRERLELREGDIVDIKIDYSIQ